MTTIALERETKDYWNLIKDATKEVKLALVALLNTSIADDTSSVGIETRPAKALRLSRLSDEEMESLMQGDSTPISNECESKTSDIVNANCGRLANGLEKWL